VHVVSAAWLEILLTAKLLIFRDQQQLAMAAHTVSAVPGVLHLLILHHHRASLQTAVSFLGQQHS
jgi:hypothetical protein